MKPSVISVYAPAKINLDLRIVGTRADGFHELRTIFQSLELHDTLVFRTRLGPFQVRCRAADVPVGRTNLIWRAAAALWSAMGREGDPRDASAAVSKRIPVAAGLGGGSADAASALVGLGRLWGARLSAAQLSDLAAGLGADVTFFLQGGTALGLGRGDEIYSLAPLDRQWVVLALPGVTVSTADAYVWYDEDVTLRPGIAPPITPPLAWPRLDGFVNDLEAPVGRRLPVVGRAKSVLASAAARWAGMSGSGSAVFGLFTDRAAASLAAREAKREGYTVIITRTTDGRAHRRLIAAW
jgi:4-diphosphocytidyl-2-C-methyl-D-erythritol kinase